MRHLATSPNATRVVTAGLLMLTLLAAGCGSQRAASDPDSAPPGSSAGTLLGPGPGSPTVDPLLGMGQLHMPLAVGNRWDYVVNFRTRLISNGSPDVIEELEYPRTSEIIGLESINEQEYYLQAEYDPRVQGPALPTSGLRQDRSGLYSLDLFVLGRISDSAPADEGLAARFESALVAAATRSSHPAAFLAAAKRLAGRLAVMSMAGRGEGLPGLSGPTGFPRASGDSGPFRTGSPLPGEIALVVNPVYKGSKWLVRESPRFARVALNREATRVPAGEFTAWVLRGFSEVYGERDVVHFWQASEGLIKITVHAEQEVIGRDGVTLGQMIIDWDQSLSALTLDPPTL